MSRHKTISNVPVTQVVDEYWTCEVVRGHVRWTRDRFRLRHSGLPFYDQKWPYKPDFEAREMPIPANGMKVLTQHLIKAKGKKRFIGEIVAWAYLRPNDRDWRWMDLPTGPIPALPTQAEIQANSKY